MRFSMILMDINMPGMNGIEASKKIVDIFSEQAIDLPIIIGQSGDTNDDLIDRCRVAGITRNITKPFTFMNFKDLLAEYDILS